MLLGFEGDRFPDGFPGSGVRHLSQLAPRKAGLITKAAMNLVKERWATLGGGGGGVFGVDQKQVKMT